MTTKDLTYDINLVDKAAAGFERIDSSFESSTVGKMLSNSSARYREIVCERMSRSMWQFIAVLFHEITTATQPSAATTLISPQRQRPDKTLHQQKDINSLKAQIMFRIF